MIEKKTLRKLMEAKKLSVTSHDPRKLRDVEGFINTCPVLLSEDISDGEVDEVRFRIYLTHIRHPGEEECYLLRPEVGKIKFEGLSDCPDYRKSWEVRKSDRECISLYDEKSDLVIFYNPRD